MSRASILRTAISLAVLLTPACAVKLAERNAPLPNGGVTGPAADCSQIQPLAKGSPGGAAAPKLVGRFDMTDPAAPTFDWSGTYIEARFQGTEVTVGLKLEQGTALVFTAIVDDGDPIRFTAVDNRDAYLVASGLPAGEHEVVLHRETEAQSGKSTFTGFDFGPGGKILPPIQRPRRIEMIGDSITCGFGALGDNAACPFDIEFDHENHPGVKLPVTENNWVSYGSVAARELDADVVTICWSGKGVSRNYTDQLPPPDDGNYDSAEYTRRRINAISTMSAKDPIEAADEPPAGAKPVTGSGLYLRTLGENPPSDGGASWDFKDPEPQAVVINLGTNDFSRDDNGDSVADGIDLAAFHQAYYDFVDFIRSKRPNAHIFLAVPPMITDNFPLDNARSDCAAVLKKIVEERAAMGDTKVYEMELVEMGTRYGLGCNYHPNVTVHQIMADQLAGAIRSKLCW